MKHSTSRPFAAAATSGLTCALVTCLVTCLIASTAFAQSGDKPKPNQRFNAAASEGYFPPPASAPGLKPDGYFPNNPSAQPVFNPNAPPPRSPVQGGLTVGLAIQAPTGGDLRLPGEPQEFRASGNLAIAGTLRFADYLELEAGLIGGAGGLNTKLYERVFGLRHMNAMHFWLGMRARAYVLDRGPVRPFLSAQFGGDRLAAIYSEGTGVLECEERYDGRFSCTEITEREFAVGYWGLSAGFGAGIRIAGLSRSLGLIIKGYGVRNRYGRATNSAVGTRRLHENSPVVWSAGGMVLVHIGAQ